MKQYKGFYIDNAIFHSEKEIDEHIKAQAIRRYQSAIQSFMEDSTMERSIYADRIAERLNQLGLTWEQIEEIEMSVYKAAG